MSGRTTKSYIVLVGNPVEGISPYGPFADREEAFDWVEAAEFEELGVTFHITNLWEPK